MTTTSSPAELMTAKVKEHVKDNWLHQFEISDDKQVSVPENLSYRWRIFNSVFESLFAGGSVLVLDEASGVYPAMIKRAGATSVTAASANESTCELIAEVTEFFETLVEVANSKVVGFYDGEPYVDRELAAGHEFMFVLNQTWPMYGASGQSFDAIAEACAYVVSDGLVFDWNNAEWASPPPPAEYNRDDFLSALRKKFDYVTCYSDWLVVALGKLPADEPVDIA